MWERSALEAAQRERERQRRCFSPLHSAAPRHPPPSRYHRCCHHHHREVIIAETATREALITPPITHFSVDASALPTSLPPPPSVNLLPPCLRTFDITHLAAVLQTAARHFLTARIPWRALSPPRYCRTRCRRSVTAAAALSPLPRHRCNAQSAPRSRALLCTSDVERSALDSRLPLAQRSSSLPLCALCFLFPVPLLCLLLSAAAAVLLFFVVLPSALSSPLLLLCLLCATLPRVQSAVCCGCPF